MTSLTDVFSSILCSVFPFVNDRSHSVCELLSMPNFPDENERVKLSKRDKIPREKCDRDSRRKLGR